MAQSNDGSVTSFAQGTMNLSCVQIVVYCTAFLLSIRQSLAASSVHTTISFLEPFRLTRSSEHRSIYTIRLDLHLYQSVGLRNYHVSELTSIPLNLRELEYQLRYNRSLRQFLHLGPAMGELPGIAAGFPISVDWGEESHYLFALLSVLPPNRDIPSITLHGFAKVRAVDETPIEEMLAGVPRQPDDQVGPGDVLSIRGIFRQVLEHHPV